MKNKALILRSEVDGIPIRYHVRVKPEVAEKYAEIRKKEPDLSEMEAFKRVKLNCNDEP